MPDRSILRRVRRAAGAALVAVLIAAGPAALPPVPLQASNPSPEEAGAPAEADVATTPAGDAGAVTDLGLIAYFDRFGADLRVVSADGSNNHVVWDNPNPNYLPIDLDWRHDGLELAFSSPHEDTCSQFDSDIYAVLADGTGYRRITNAPACAELAPLPKGSITVEVTAGVMTFVYAPGAPGPVGPASGHVQIDNIADFGPGVYQRPVAILPSVRQLFGPPFPDILPGQTVPGGVIITSTTTGYPYGAGAPSWRADDSSIAYHQRTNVEFLNISANPGYGEDGDALPTVADASAVLIDWNPANNHQYLYYSSEVNSDAAHGIWLHDLNDPAQCSRLYHPGAYENSPADIDWLADGTGFLFVHSYNGFLNTRGYTCGGSVGSCRNIFKYDLATGHITQLTDFSDMLTHLISVSSDGQSIIFEQWTDPDFDTGGDLWIMDGDGSNPHLFLEDAARPAWFGPGGAVPAMAPFVTIEMDAIGNYLSWDDFEVNVGGYKVRYSEKPYFQVGDAGVTTVDVEPGYEGWVHEGGAGDPAHNYTYFVQGVGAGDALSGPSNRTGGFTFGLVKGG